MTLQEIKEKIPGSNPGEIVDLSKKSNRILLKSDQQAYKNFRGEYFSDISELIFTRSPENANKLAWLVDTLIAM